LKLYILFIYTYDPLVIPVMESKFSGGLVFGIWGGLFKLLSGLQLWALPRDTLQHKNIFFPAYFYSSFKDNS